MRISDGSSDVCSSDLEASGRAKEDGTEPAFPGDHAGVPRLPLHPADGNRLRAREGRLADRAGRHLSRGAVLDCRCIPARTREIGSASCRERVCQYLEFSVVAVYLKKKTETKVK